MTWSVFWDLKQCIPLKLNLRFESCVTSVSCSKNKRCKKWTRRVRQAEQAACTEVAPCRNGSKMATNTSLPVPCFCQTANENWHIGFQLPSVSKSLQAAFFRSLSCSNYSSTLKIEVTCSSENSVNFQRTTRPNASQRTSLFMISCWYLSILALLSAALRWFFAWLIHRPWICRPQILPERHLTFNGIHGIIPRSSS